MTDPEVNRLATPLPDSVLDRYYAEHPDEIDHRPPRATRPDLVETDGQLELAPVVRVDALLDSIAPGAGTGTGGAYDGWPLIEDVEVDGFLLGEITDFLDTPATDGDAFIQAPDGGRAGLSWTQAAELTVEQLAPLDERRWGVWEITVPLPLVTTADVRPFLEAIVPLLRPHWERWPFRGSAPAP
jgi:hypothetical protein